MESSVTVRGVSSSENIKSTQPSQDYTDVPVLTQKQSVEQKGCTINRTLLPLKMFYFFFYGACGSVIPFISVLMKSLHLTAAETGVVTGVSVLIAIFLRTAIGVAADKMAARKALLLLCCVGFGSAFFFLWFVPQRTVPYPASHSHTYKPQNRSDADSPSSQEQKAQGWVCFDRDWSQLCRYPPTSGHVPCRLIASGPAENNSSSDRHLRTASINASNLPLNGMDTSAREQLVDSPSSRRRISSPLSTSLGGRAFTSPIRNHEIDSPCFVLTKPKVTPSLVSPESEIGGGGGESLTSDTSIRKDSITASQPPPTVSQAIRKKSEAEEKAVPCLPRCHLVYFGPDGPTTVSALQHHSGAFRTTDEVSDAGLASHAEMTVAYLPREINRVETDSSKPKSFQVDSAFLVSFLLVTTARGFYSSATSLADAMAYTTLGPNPLKWGRQRLWGTLGTALSVMTATTVNDQLEGNSFDALFFLCLALSLLATLVGGVFLSADRSPRRASLRRDVWQLLGQANVRLFLLKLVAYGIMCGTAQNFFLWFLVDLGSEQTTLGLCVAVHCTSSVVVLRFSSRLFKLVSHATILHLVMATYVIRFVAFSFLENAWLALLPELLHGVTYALMWAAASSTASQMAPPGTQASCQAIAGAAYWDLGRGLGNLLAGQMIQAIGGRWTFRAYGAACAVLLPIFWLQDRAWPISRQHLLPVATQEHDLDIKCTEKDKYDQNSPAINTESYIHENSNNINNNNNNSKSITSNGDVAHIQNTHAFDPVLAGQTLTDDLERGERRSSSCNASDRQSTHSIDGAGRISTRQSIDGEGRISTRQSTDGADRISTHSIDECCPCIDGFVGNDEECDAISCESDNVSDDPKVCLLQMGAESLGTGVQIDDHGGRPGGPGGASEDAESLLPSLYSVGHGANGCQGEAVTI